MEKNSKFSGLQYSIYYCLCTTISVTLIGHLEQRFNPMMLILSIFSATLLIFNVLIAKQYRRTWQQIWQLKTLFIMANVYTVLIWILIYIALKYLHPALTVAYFFSVMPLATLVIQVLNKTIKLNPAELILAVIILLTIVLLMEFNHAHHDLWYYINVLFCFIAGISSALYNVLVKKIFNYGVTVNQVMANRFWLIFLISLGYLLFFKSEQFAQFHWVELPYAIFIALISSLLPMYWLQKAIKLSTPQAVSCLITSIPILVYIVQQIFLGYPFVLIQAVLIFLLAIFLLLLTLVTLRT